MARGALDRLRERWVGRLGLPRLAARPAPFGGSESRAPARKSFPGTEPDITVVIPAFQHERYVCEALRSVLAQTCPAFRILVVDDGSTDATVARARSITDPRITVRVNPRNLGLGGSLAAALGGVRTPFVALLNSDDLFHPERLEQCLAELRDEPAIEVVATGMVLADSRGGLLTPENASWILDGRRIFHWVRWYRNVCRDPGGSDPLFLRLLRHNFLLSSSNIVCRTSFLRGRTEQLARLNYCLDWDVFLAAAATGGLRYLPAPLLAYRLHASNTVWFSRDTRREYSAEVERVAGMAVRRLLEGGAEGAGWLATCGGSAWRANEALGGTQLLREELQPILDGRSGTRAAELASAFLASVET